MEAPVKLYVDTNDELSSSILYGFTEKRKEDDIEYTSTDAFIEKACEWLKEHINNYTCLGYKPYFDLADNERYETFAQIDDSFIKDFRKEMKK